MEELNKKMAAPAADFDWDSYAKGDVMTSEAKAELTAK